VQSIQTVLTDLGIGSLNWSDYILLFVLILSTLISIIRGFLRETISLVTWILAFWSALKFSHWLAERLAQLIPHNTLRNVAAVIILLVAVLLAGMLVAHCADKLIKKGKLSTLDRLLGMCFGLVRGALIASLLLFFGQIMALDQSEWWKNSKTIPWFKKPVDLLQERLPKQLEKISIMMLLNHPGKPQHKNIDAV
jgi:membrane protein required for colicin V production